MCLSYLSINHKDLLGALIWANIEVCVLHCLQNRAGNGETRPSKQITALPTFIYWSKYAHELSSASRRVTLKITCMYRQVVGHLSPNKWALICCYCSEEGRHQDLWHRAVKSLWGLISRAEKWSQHQSAKNNSSSSGCIRLTPTLIQSP